MSYLIMKQQSESGTVSMSLFSKTLFAFVFSFILAHALLWFLVSINVFTEGSVFAFGIFSLVPSIIYWVASGVAFEKNEEKGFSLMAAFSTVLLVTLGINYSSSSGSGAGALVMLIYGVTFMPSYLLSMLFLLIKGRRS